MRKVTYFINDCEYMRELYKDIENIEGILECLPPPFICNYTLIADGENRHPDDFEIVDGAGNKICMNSLNGYQKGVVLNSCYNHFIGGSEPPFGVVRMEEVYE